MQIRTAVDDSKLRSTFMIHRRPALRLRAGRIVFVLMPALLFTLSSAYALPPPSGPPAGGAQPIAGAGLPAKPRLDNRMFLPAIAGPIPYDWLQFDGDPQHSGNNVHETAISTVTVSSLQPLFSVSLPNTVDGAPVFLSVVNTANGVQDLLFATTMAGDVVALDAHSGKQVWSRRHPATGCVINNISASGACYTTSSPVIDPNRQFVYAYGLDGYVHKHQVGDGTEIQAAGWPEPVTTKNFDEKGSSALSMATAHDGVTYLYVVTAGYPGDPGDQGDYQGHVTAINLSDGTQHVFNALCSDQVDVHFVEPPHSPDCGDQQAGVWSRAGVVYDPATDRIYATTGNGDFNPGQHDWGDTVFALNPNGTGVNGSPLDSYTPSDHQYLQDNDLDLGSTTLALLPVQAQSNVRHLALQGGKDHSIHLIDLDNMSGHGGPGHVGGEVSPVWQAPIEGEMHTQPAVWVNPADGATWVFITTYSGVVAYRVDYSSGTPYLDPVWTDDGGTSPLVANNVLFYASDDTLVARDAGSGHLLWYSTQTMVVHWQSPVVINGIVYLADSGGHMNAYSLLAGAPHSPTDSH